MPKTLSGNEIRQSFIDFYRSKNHTFVPSASLVPGGDATLLFTNAGMVQFKDVFLGTDKRPYTRAANSQKCMRVSGKHNDLEDVGRDDTHHTFFEMLGNWSFGDYYKKEAISWAWELLTEVWGLEKSRLYATVFEDEHGEIPTDDEAIEYWKIQPGFDPNHVFNLGRKDNFWEMAETGPCGPSSEIHYDLDPDQGEVTKESLDTTRFLEIWNLVFIQYNRIDESRLEPLPATHVDTGMGLDRITSILQGVPSNYLTDLFLPLIQATQSITGHTDEQMRELFTPYRVIADHVRAATFLISDGVVPGNIGRNYVTRMIIRRAYRFAGKIGIHNPFMKPVIEAMIANYGEAYPDLVKNQKTIIDAITSEEEQFQRTLDKATGHLDVLLDRLADKRLSEISGETAADLYTTYGMPLEITRDIAQERDFQVDEQGFAEAIERHRLVSSGTDTNDDNQIFQVEFYNQIKTELIEKGILPPDGVIYDPYGELTFETRIAAIIKDGQRVDSATAGDKVVIILPQTHFYLEAGGQVSDTGRLNTSGAIIQIEEIFRPAAGILAHRGTVVEGEILVDEAVNAVIDAPRRQDIMRNHTATHLLHAALHHVLGDHARQAGSLVAPDRLRFDFTHREGLTAAELAEIEAYVNDKIYSDIPLIIEHKALTEAIGEGATALFGEKYGEIVRTIQMEDEDKFSYELCGGTHVTSTGEIGMFLITSEGSAAAGIRRIEAITGRKAYDHVHRQAEVLRSATHILTTSPDQITEKINDLLQKIGRLEDENKKLKQQFALTDFDSQIEKVEQVEGVHVFTGKFENTDIDTLRTLADQYRAKYPENSIGLFAGISDGKPVLIGMVAENLTRSGIRAGDLVKHTARLIGGGGGGKPTLAQAGGKDVEKIDEALDSVVPWLQEQIAKQKA